MGGSVDIPEKGDDAKLLPWGMHYVGKADLAVAADAAETALAGLGMDVRRQELSAGELRLSASQRLSFSQTFFGALPQRAEVVFAAANEDLRIAADFQVGRWYSGLTFLIALLYGPGLIGAGALFAHQAKSGDSLEYGLAAAAAIVGSLAALGVVRLLSALGGSRIDRAFWEPIRRAVEDSAGFLAPEGPAARRHRFVFYALGAWLTVITAIVAFGGEDPAIHLLGSWSPLLYGLFLVCGLLVLGELQSWNVRGLGQRILPLTPGLLTGLAATLLLLVPLSWTWAARLALQDERVRVNFVRIAPENLPEEFAAEVAQLFLDLRNFTLFMIAYSLVLTAVAVWLLLRAVSFARQSQPELDRLATRSADGVYRLAIGDGKVIRWLQRALGAIWLVVGLGMAAAGVSTLWCAASSVPGWPVEWTHPAVEGSTLVAGAFGFDRDDPLLDAAIRIGWLLCGALVAGVFLLSFGQLWSTRRRLRARLGSRSEPPPAKIAEAFDRLCKRAGRAVRFVRSSEGVSPRAHHCGFLAPRRFVEVPSLLLEKLATEDLEALLAHELAHHLNGDCRLDNRIRYLARATFFGDGFARALCDSFGNESRADRSAVQFFGIPPQRLIRALRRLRELGNLAHLQAIPEAQPAPIQEGPRPALWEAFAKYYFEAMDHYYWHPPKDQRLAEIKALPWPKEGV